MTSAGHIVPLRSAGIGSSVQPATTVTRHIQRSITETCHRSDDAQSLRCACVWLLGPTAAVALPFVQNVMNASSSVQLVVVVLLGLGCARDDRAPVPPTLSGKPMLDPVPAGYEIAFLAGGCFWGMEE